MADMTHKPTKATRKQVETMAGYGIPEDGIAESIGISAPTLRKYYAKEIKLGHVKANEKVAAFLYTKATTDGPQAVTAAIFWAKTRMRWRETDRLEHTGAGGGPIRTESVDLTKLSDEELDAYIAIRQKMDGAPGDDDSGDD